MKIHTTDSETLSGFKLLAFNCFGTLVDWESAYRHPKRDRVSVLKHFNEIETSICASKPDLIYSILSEAYMELADALGLRAPADSEADAFGALVDKGPIFPDTVEALKQLKKHYKLVILSNLDKKSFTQVLKSALAGIEF